MLEPAEGGELLVRLRHVGGRTVLRGRDAERAAALLMPHANRFGGNRQTVASAVGEIENEGSAEAFLARIARVARVSTRPVARMPKRWNWGTKIPRSGLFALHEPQRLALEMALHEESERRALEGELAELERAWQQAEEIAGIADNLLLPESVDEFMRREREKPRDESAP
jgi:hypothetical protein